MKKILVICGAGHATSTIAVSKIKQWLSDSNLNSGVEIYQSKISEEINNFDNYDIVVSTTIVPDSVKDKVINGVPLFTGVGKDKVFEEIKKGLDK